MIDADHETKENKLLLAAALTNINPQCGQAEGGCGAKTGCLEGSSERVVRTSIIVFIWSLQLKGAS